MFVIRPDITTKSDLRKSNLSLQKWKWTYFLAASVRKHNRLCMYFIGIVLWMQVKEEKEEGVLRCPDLSIFFPITAAAWPQRHSSALSERHQDRVDFPRSAITDPHTLHNCKDSIWERNQRKQTKRFMTLFLWSRALNDTGCLVNVQIHLHFMWATCRSPDRSGDSTFRSAVNKMSWKQDLARGSGLQGPPTAWLVKANRSFYAPLRPDASRRWN